MLGGYCKLSDKPITTEISLSDFPQIESVRVEATFHFIDAWAGQTAYLKVGDAYVWTDSFDFTQTKNALNICGGDIGEGKFSSQVDAIIGADMVKGKKLELEFGSTLQTDAC